MPEGHAQMPGECLHPETLAAYVDGRLDPSQRPAVERHLATCPACYEWLSEILETAQMLDAADRPEDARVPVTSRRWSAWKVAAAGLAAAATVVLFVRLGVGPRSTPSGPGSAEASGIQLLVAAVGDRRPLEPRLTGGFGWGTPPSEVRSTTSPEPPLAWREAALRLERAASDSETPAHIGALGSAYLVLGDTERGVDMLERASAIDPANGALQNDLAAAYLERARKANRPADLVKAQAAAARALAARPDLLEARFNLALALEQSGLVREAIAAWDSYLQADSGSPWAGEARQHLERLRQRTESVPSADVQQAAILAAIDGADDALAAAVTRYPQAGRELIEEKLLIEAVSGRREWRQVDRLAQVLARVSSDRLPIDAAARVRSAGQAAALAGLQKYAQAREVYVRSDIDGAAVLFEEAQRSLEPAGVPLWGWAAFYRGVATYYRGRFDEARAVFEAVARDSAAHGYLNLQARAHWMLGLVFVGRGEFSRSLEAYESARRCFELTREADGLVYVNTLFAENRRDLGEADEAWRLQFAALRQAPSVSARRRYAILVNGALAALDEDRPEAALHFQNEAVVAARESGSPVFAAEAYTRQASALVRLHSQDAAAAALHDAATWSAKASPTLRQLLEAEIAAVRGELWRGSRPTDAVNATRASLAFFSAQKRARRLPGLQLLLARALLSAGDTQGAVAALNAGIATFEAQRTQLPTDELRISYFDEAWRLFDELIALHLQSGDAGAALQVAERARARVLLESLTPAKTPALPDVASLLDQDSAVLYFVSLPDRLAAWTITSDGTAVSETRITGAELRAQVIAYQLALRSGRPGAGDRQAQRLYELLLAPSRARLGSRTLLVIVPDRDLHFVPFPALIDPATHEYAIQRYSIGVAPSLAAIAAATVRSASLPRAAERALVIGPPALDRQRYPELAPLRSAAEESERVAQVYRGATLVSGADATRARFERGIRDAEVLHFAGHGVYNARLPLYSRLLLAPDRTNDGTVYAHEIAAMPLAAMRLVVLAACGSGAGYASRGEGLLSLARPFLAAGVPAVVATLWDLNDRAGLALFTEFHRGYRASADPIRALRAAQLVLLAHGDAAMRDPAAWAGVMVASGLPDAGSPPTKTAQKTAAANQRSRHGDH